MSTIDIDDDVYERIQKIGAGLFTDKEVMRRLVDFYQNRPNSENEENPLTGPIPKQASPARARADGADLLSLRRARSRGARVRLGADVLVCSTVGDLLEQVFRRLLGGEKRAQVEEMVPYWTSNQRYLIAKTAVHPNNNPFWASVEVDGYFIEAHKNYETAVKQIEAFTAKLGIDFEYLGK